MANPSRCASRRWSASDAASSRGGRRREASRAPRTCPAVRARRAGIAYGDAAGARICAPAISGGSRRGRREAVGAGGERGGGGGGRRRVHGGADARGGNTRRCYCRARRGAVQVEGGAEGWEDLAEALSERGRRGREVGRGGLTEPPSAMIKVKCSTVGVRASASHARRRFPRPRFPLVFGGRGGRGTVGLQRVARRDAVRAAPPVPRLGAFAAVRRHLRVGFPDGGEASFAPLGVQIPPPPSASPRAFVLTFLRAPPAPRAPPCSVTCPADLGEQRGVRRGFGCRRRR